MAHPKEGENIVLHLNHPQGLPQHGKTVCGCIVTVLGYSVCSSEQLINSEPCKKCLTVLHVTKGPNRDVGVACLTCSASESVLMAGF